MLAAAPRDGALSQSPVVAPRPALVGQWAVEQQSRQRWLHGRQQSRFTPFTSARQWTVVDSIRGDTTANQVYLTLGRNAYGRDPALIVATPAGQVAHLETGLARFARRVTFPGDSARYEDMRRRGTDGDVALPAARIWDLVATTPPHAPRVGLAWTDTIARVATDGEFRQALRGTQNSRIIGERIAGGRRLWVVRDSAAVTYEEQYPERERTLDTTALISRRVRGTIRGTHLYDPAVALPRERDDTTSLAGDATLSYPDGRSFRTPARFERTRHWTLLDAPAYAARMTELNSARQRGMGGMVIVPEGPLEKRLAAGEVTSRDSLLAVWRRTTDPDSAAARFQLLERWSAGSAVSRAVVERARFAAGDTAYLYTRLSERVERPEPLDSADVRALLPFMEDPALAWSVNLSADWPYENIVQVLVARPPAAADAVGQYRSVACTPAACRLLADQWRSAHEARLRDVGLVARFSTDPARWGDTVLALDGPRHPLLHDAALLAGGVGAVWPAASKAPLPPPHSDWRAWLEWMDGRDPRYVATKRQLPVAGGFNADTLPQVRFEESHAVAIRFYQARTGRDVVGELRREYASATSDSARYVFGAMLDGLGALEPSDSLAARWFRSGEPAQLALARRMLGPGFAKAVRADSSVAIPLLEQLLGAIADSAPLWPRFAAEGKVRRRDPALLHRARGSFFVDTLGLPARIRAEWGSRVPIMPQSGWTARDVREAGVFYSIAPITTWGPFARVQVTSSERIGRKPNEAPVAFASSTTYWLMNVDGQWVIVDESAWVT